MTLNRSERWLDALAGSRARALAVLLLFGLILYLPGIAALHPMDRDEPRFAQASRQMAESDSLADWVVPRG